METSERLRQYLTQYHHKYPQTWKKIDEFRAQQNSTGWGNWCFCPLERVQSIISESGKPTFEAGVLTGLAAWRVTQGIYHFDPTVFEAVWQTKITGNIPVEILYCLPEWSVYIETPGKVIGTSALNGFFVYLNQNHLKNHDEFWLIFDVENELFSLPIHLSQHTILDSLQEIIQSLTFQGKKLGIDSGSYLKNLEQLSDLIEPLLSLTLYLCSQLAEVPDFSFRQPVNFNLKNKRFYPPATPVIWEVAYRLGTALRKAESFEQETSSITGSRMRPRPHIRRAHWHGYWFGAKQDMPKFQLKWLPPIPVNVTEDNPVIPTFKNIS